MLGSLGFQIAKFEISDGVAAQLSCQDRPAILNLKFGITAEAASNRGFFAVRAYPRVFPFEHRPLAAAVYRGRRKQAHDAFQLLFLGRLTLVGSLF
jgi:hypothetical protein